MGLETPVGAAVHARRGKRALYAHVLLVRLDLLGNSLESGKVVQSVDALDGGPIRGKVGIEQRLVVDDAVGLHDVGNTDDRAVIEQRKIIAGQMRIHFAVLHVVAIILPVAVAHGAVDLEKSGSFGLGDLALKGGLVGAGGGGHDGDGHAGLLGVELGKTLPLLILLGLEVEIINGAGGRFGLGGNGLGGGSRRGLGGGSGGGFSGGSRGGSRAGYGAEHHERYQQNRNDFLHVSFSPPVLYCALAQTSFKPYF